MPRNTRKKIAIAISGAIPVLLLMGFILPNPWSSSSVPPSIVEPAPLVEVVPQGEVTTEKPIPTGEKLMRRPRRRYSRRKRRPIARLPEESPPSVSKPKTDPKQPTQPIARPKKKHYPKAKPKTAKPMAQVPQKKQNVARVAQPKRVENGGGIRLGSEVSWTSLPASGSPLNGHIKFKIKPPVQKGKTKIKRNLVVLIDVSGSMKVSLKRIATPVILMMDRLGPDDRGVVVAFSNKAKVFSAGTALKTYLSQLQPLTRASYTDLAVGLRRATAEIGKGQHQGRVDQFVILTDGLTGDGRSLTHQQKCLQLSSAARVPITILGYGEKCNRTLLTQMATQSGGKFTYVEDVSQLLESVMGDVIGLSGVVSRNNRLIVTLRSDIKVNNAYVLGRQGRKLGKARVLNGRIEIPLGEFKEGQELSVVLEVVLPKGEVGTVTLADAEVHYQEADGASAVSSESEVVVEYTEKGSVAQRNAKMKDVLMETREAGSSRRI